MCWTASNWLFFLDCSLLPCYVNFRRSLWWNTVKYITPTCCWKSEKCYKINQNGRKLKAIAFILFGIFSRVILWLWLFGAVILYYIIIHPSTLSFVHSINHSFRTKIQIHYNLTVRNFGGGGLKCSFFVFIFSVHRYMLSIDNVDNGIAVVL